MNNYIIEKIPRDKQDETMKVSRYKVTLEDNTPFICRRLDIRPNHVYFSENTQHNISLDTLDEIEQSILDMEKEEG